MEGSSLEVKEGYTVTIEGDADSVSWTSVPPAAGVLSKEGQCYQDLPGGLSGDVDKIRYGISHITLCGNSNGGCVGPCCNGGCNGVPEFSTLTLALAVIGATLGLAFVRKH